MKAGSDFIAKIGSLPKSDLAKASRIEVRLFGSLSATGKGHWTDRGVVAGLLGQSPESCPPDFLDGLLADEDSSYDVEAGGKIFRVSKADIIFDNVKHDYPHTNTLVIRLMEGGNPIFEREYYSIGGGFLQWNGYKEPGRGEPRYGYGNMSQLKVLLEKHRLKLHELIIENEKSITGRSEAEIFERLKRLILVMEESIERGIKAEGLLPGPLGLHRKARSLYLQSEEMADRRDSFLVAMNAYAMAVAEESAAGHLVVTAPTCGASGVIPAVFYSMKKMLGLPAEALLQGLMAACAVGFLAKNNASLAGAEVGCQGEIGVASCMAAAMATELAGHDLRVMENASETAMEHHLGLTCDPVGGYVQIPCIERNAMGAVKAYNAYLIAVAEVAAYHLVDLDRVMEAMAETGKDMSTKYKETAKGGLAVSMVNC